MSLSKREIISLSVLGVFLTVYLFYLYVYQPLNNSTVQLINENNQLEAVNVLAGKLTSEDSGEIETVRVAKFIELNRKVPEKPYIPETIKLIEDLSREHSLKITRTLYDREKSSPPAEQETIYKECYFEIEVKGTYLSLIKLVRDLEKSERLYDIDNIKMIAVNAQTGDTQNALVYNPDNIIMTVLFKSYYDEITLPDIKEGEQLAYTKQMRLNPFVKP